MIVQVSFHCIGESHFMPTPASRLAMRLLLLTSYAIAVASQIFENENFNVTEALISQGVDVSALPQLNAITERLSDLGCSIAVGLYWKIRDLRIYESDSNLVLLVEYPIRQRCRRLQK